MRAMMVVIVVFATGCEHALEIKNLRSYQSVSLSSLTSSMTIGIVPSASDLDTQRLIKGVGEGLGKYSANVLLPYSPNGGRPVDVIAKISVTPEYSGSGWNFLINFPGFLIWAPAWNGYVYEVGYQVNVLLTAATTNEKIAAWTLPIKLNVRHASTNRTWTEISWLEVGVIALVGGFVFIGYDETVTPLVAEKIQMPIGDYIAEEIVNRLNSYGPLARAPAPLIPPPAPVIVEVPVSRYAAGQSVSVRQGAQLVQRPLSTAGMVAQLDAGKSVALRTSLINSYGIWWFVDAGPHQGWLLESDLIP